MYYRSDFEPGHLPHEQEANDWQPCVLAIYNFASVFLFSVETQHTIGYGTRYVFILRSIILVKERLDFGYFEQNMAARKEYILPKKTIRPYKDTQGHIIHYCMKLAILFSRK